MCVCDSHSPSDVQWYSRGVTVTPVQMPSGTVGGGEGDSHSPSDAQRYSRGVTVTPPSDV